MAFCGPKSGLQLPRDILHHILDLVEEDADKFVRPDQRAYLSVEAFGTEKSSQSIDATHTLKAFRLTCKEFAAFGAKYLFAKVAARLGVRELERLSMISKSAHIASHVQKLVYIVPYFYVKDDFDMLKSKPHSYLFTAESRSRFKLKAQEYQQIITANLDQQVLKSAFSAFGRLRHLQLVGRIGDEDDNLLYAHIRRFDVDVAEYIDMQWEPACTRAMQAIVEAWTATRNACSKLSVNRMSSRTASRLSQTSGSRLHALASQLTNVVLHFDTKDFEVDATEPLAGMLNSMFRDASAIETVHVGFPPHPLLMPRTLGLEQVFGDVQWPRLRSFGVEGWKLTGEDIITFARRYKTQLTSFRLRHVGLKVGMSSDEVFMWKDVLLWLRDNMERLEWVSLRRIGYTATWEDIERQMGHEVLDDFPGAPSDDESDDAGEGEQYQDNFRPQDHALIDFTTPRGPSSPAEGSTSSLSGSPRPRTPASAYGSSSDPWLDHDVISDGLDQADLARDTIIGFGHAGQVVSVGLPPITQLFSSFTRGSSLPSKDALASMSAEELGDNGIVVREHEWKLWEKWVCARRGR